MERLPMFKTREILRLRWALGRSVRQTARSVDVSVGVVSSTTHNAAAAGLTWEGVQALEDAELEARVYPGVPTKRTRPEPSPAELHVALRRAGMTLELLHLEYLAEHPDGLRYTAFCERLRAWRARRSPWMRQVHHAGDKLFVDFSGKKPRIVDAATGVVREVELFVGVLGASNLTYAEAVPSQRIEDWIGAHVRMLEFFGGVPQQLVPDQLRSAVSMPSRYEPVIQRTYAELARHYGTAVVPARPGKPRDKGKVEVAVQIVQRWVLARLRHETFFSLERLNERMRELLEELNRRPMRQLNGMSRLDVFNRIERSALRSLPATPFVFATWKQARVNLDYHVEHLRHLYSVPCQLLHERVELRVTANTVEVFHRGARVASHSRDDTPYMHTTVHAHMPANHRAWLESDPGEVFAWARAVGPCAEAFMRRLLDESNPIPQTRWRSARGLKRVGEKYPAARVEAACESALRFGATSYRTVERMLQLGREASGQRGSRVPIEHDNVRGPEAFDLN
jgi:transposase